MQQQIIPAPWIGFVDPPRAGSLVGWVASSEPGVRLVVDLFVDGSLADTTVADEFRPDLRDAGYRDGRFGFQFYVPEQYLDGGDHDFDIRVRDTDIEFQGGRL